MEIPVGERIKVVDSRCGAGKSTFAIQYMNSLDKDTKVIYITPFLDETERIKRECPERDFFLPNNRSGRGSKMTNFTELVAKGRNIASTHALFGNITDELIQLLRSQSYILVLDEVINVVEKLDLYKEDIRKTEFEKEVMIKADIKTMIDQNIIIIDEETKQVSWGSDSHILNKYSQLKQMADRGLLYYLDGDLLIWTFPIDVFREGLFDEIYILTYQFEYQIQAYYYDYFNVPYSKYRVQDVGGRNYKLFEIDDEDYESEWRKEISKLISICDNDKLNKIGNVYLDNSGNKRDTALSKNWYETSSSDNINILKNNIYNYFRRVTNAKSNQKLWTTFKDYKKVLKDGHIPVKCWLECNCRASNEYADRNVLVYAINRYLNPFYKKFFYLKGIQLNEDAYALSELIQWVFRSAIRNGEPIQIYIPSVRMRTLFQKWLDNEI